MLNEIPSCIEDGTAEVVFQPMRFKILKTLSERKRPLFIEQISHITGISPRLASHHVSVLEKKGVVESKYKLAETEGSKRRVAVRVVSISPQLKDVFDQVRNAVTWREP